MMATAPDTSTARSAAASADNNVASMPVESVVDAVMPHGALMPAQPSPSFSSAETTSIPLSTTELRDHMIALYNTTDSIRKYCRANGIPSKRTTLSTAMAESGLAKRKQADFPFDKTIIKLIDDYSKTYSARKSVNAKMGRTDLKEHLLAMYASSDSIRKYCKDHNLATRRSTMTRAFADSGLAAKKEAKEPLDDSITALVEVYLNKLPSMREKPAEAAKKPAKIAMKTAKQSLIANKNKQPAPDEVQMEYCRSVLRTTPAGKVVEVVKDGTTEAAMRDVKDPDRWYMVNQSGGPPIPVTTSDLLKWTVKRADVGLKETPNLRAVPLAVEDMAKEIALTERQAGVDAVFAEANDKVKLDLLEKISDESLKETLEKELKDIDVLASVKEDLQGKLDEPFKTTVSVTHEGKARSLDVTMGGLVTVVKPKPVSSKKRKATEGNDSSAKSSAKQQKKTGDDEEASAVEEVAV